MMNKDIFERTVKSEFKYLLDEYGFSTPKTDDYGREVFIRFEKGYKEVSISCEFGSAPIIELFYPVANTGNKATPWAKKDGIERTRRFHRLKVKTKYSAEDESSSIKHIKEMALSFKNTESEWLED